MNKVPPPILMLAGIGLEWCLSRYFPAIPLDQPLLHWAGGLFIASAVILAITSISLFVKARTTLIPHGDPSTFVARGPYRISRNPMYLGLTSALIGAAAQFGGVSGFVVPLMFAALISSVYIPVEERALLHKFGEQYMEYQQRVRRWI